MAKTIKFNLICDGDRSVRTLEDLREQATVEDYLNYYGNGLLARWLEVRGYENELKAVQALTGRDSMDQMTCAKALLNIFQPDMGESDIERAVYILQYREERRASEMQARKLRNDQQALTDAFRKSYFSVIRDVVDHKDDMPRIKAAVAEIDTTYRSLFDMNYRRLWQVFYCYAPMALFAMLMRDHMRKAYLPQVENIRQKVSILEYRKVPKTLYSRVGNYRSYDMEEGPFYESFTKEVTPFNGLASFIKAFKTEKLLETQAKGILFEECGNFIGDKETALIRYVEEDLGALYLLLQNGIDVGKDLERVLGKELHSFTGKTEGYWKDLESPKKKYMILHMEKGNFVRAAGDMNGDLDSDKVNGWFPIVSGIDYKSNSDTDKLLYLEV